MRWLKRLIWILILLCFSSSLAWTATESSDEAAGAQLHILFTHDLHSYFFPHRVSDAQGDVVTLGGYARLAYLIEQKRREHHEATLLVDAGDFSMGTLFHTAFMTEAFELRLMGEMGYDVTTLGNHDFDYHVDGLAKTLFTARSKGKNLPAIVASNVVFSEQDPGDAMLKKAFAAYPVEPYLILEKNGLRIGVFGLMGKDAADDTPSAHPVTFPDPVRIAAAVVQRLRTQHKVDLIICLSHSGTSPDRRRSEDERLAKAVPDIDVIISGHTHTLLPRPIRVGKTLIVSAGCYGRYLGSLQIVPDRDGRFDLVAYELIPVDDQVPEHPPIAKMVSGFKAMINRDFLAPFRLALDTPVAHLPYAMEPAYDDRHPELETGLGNLITDAFRYAVKRAEGPVYEHVSVAFQPFGLIRDHLYEGDITVDDVFRVLSLGLGPDGLAGYPLVAFYVTGRELKHIFEVHTTVAPRSKSDAYLQLSGARFTYNPHRIPFDRVTSIEVQDPGGDYSPVDPKKLYRVCANLYAATLIDYVSEASFGLLSVHPKDAQGTRIKDVKTAIVQVERFAQVKEWMALHDYLRSFDEDTGKGLPVVPDRYRAPEGRIISNPAIDPLSLIRGGNAVTYGFLFFVCFLVAVCGLAIGWFVYRSRKRMNPMSAVKR